MTVVITSLVITVVITRLCTTDVGTVPDFHDASIRTGYDRGYNEVRYDRRSNDHVMGDR